MRTHTHHGYNTHTTAQIEDTHAVTSHGTDTTHTSSGHKTGKQIMDMDAHVNHEHTRIHKSWDTHESWDTKIMDTHTSWRHGYTHKTHRSRAHTNHGHTQRKTQNKVRQGKARRGNRKRREKREQRQEVDRTSRITGTAGEREREGGKKGEREET